MQNVDSALLFSATDLVNFLGCQHATFLDLRQLSAPIELPASDAQAELLRQKGIEHEQSHLARLKAEARSVVEVSTELPLSIRVEQTRQAMSSGAEVIYQGALLLPPWHAYSDFLIRVDEPSKFGAWSYEVADTKLSRAAKPKHVVQLCTYSALVGHEQRRLPRAMRIVLGDGSEVSLSVNDYLYYFKLAQARFQAFCARPPATSTGEPCGHCGQCRWIAQCEAEWEKSDHLCLVANIRRDQIAKLREAGITMMASLAQIPGGTRVGNLQPDTLTRLRSQARLQVEKRDDGQNRCEVLPRQPGEGFDRLPRPSEGDLFFDMEGDPLWEDGGLEYLFGFVHQEPGRDAAFTPFWAHSREEEKIAFERAIDFIMERLRRYPDAYIFHFAVYEETALKRLAMYHGTREAEVDDLLRRRKLVDLYRIVREAIRVSEPSYSIKNLETFYFPDGRTGEVTTAGDSIVVYERWRRLGLPELLQEIEAYNATDCRSTRMCRDWLLALRPQDAT
jgi:predicted RecB family nuclease